MRCGKCVTCRMGLDRGFLCPYGSAAAFDRHVAELAKRRAAEEPPPRKPKGKRRRNRA